MNARGVQPPRSGAVMNVRGQPILGQVVLGIHQALGATERLKKEERIPEIHLAQPLPHALASLEVQNRVPPRFAIELEEALRTERRLPERMVHVEIGPPAGAERWTHLLEVGGARQGCQ